MGGLDGKDRHACATGSNCQSIGVIIALSHREKEGTETLTIMFTN
jgi:hypothetical protein